MSIDVGHISRWTPWRDVEVHFSEGDPDIQLTDYVPSDLSPEVRAKMLAVTPGNMLAIRGWGVGVDNSSAEVVISGWMDPEKDAGPGQILWWGVIFLGAFLFSTERALYAGPLPTSLTVPRTWREVDCWDETAGGVADYFDAVNLVQINNTTGGGQCVVLFPTLGYTHLLAEIVTRYHARCDPESVRIVLMAREVARGKVIHTSF